MSESNAGSRSANPIRIEHLMRHHRRESFACGEASLDNYIQRIALQQQERGIGRTFVAVEEGGDGQILGYYTLAAGRIAFENLPLDKKLPPRVPVPVVLLGRLAVDDIPKGCDLGKLLLLHALWRSEQIAAQAGVYAVEVDALHDEASRFYARYGFVPLLDNPLHLYLPMRTIIALNLRFPSTETTRGGDEEKGSHTD
jgi:GNAT superfamily N-acetyltransferase